ncbi:DNA methyltransferase Dim-2 [Neopestalotiopsis sp. 37M]|nr:DNA methyltransferase Dim-2 [Neopestalotiopsis sp. 37M]
MAEEDHDFSLRPSTPDGHPSMWTKFGDSFLYENGTSTPERFLNMSQSPRLSEFSFGIPELETSRTASPATLLAMNSSDEDVPPDPILEKQTSPRQTQSFQETLNEIKHMPRSSNIIVDLPKSTLVHPRSAYSGFIPSAPHVREHEAVSALLDALDNTSDEFIEIGLTDFTIYLDSAIYPIELRPLHQLATQAAGDKFYFDGILHHGEQRYFVQKIPFRELPIGNYCDTDKDSVDDQIWIRSMHNRKKEIYYKLEKPSTDYERYWVPFLWVADLAKHVVDYCSHLQQKKRKARLDDFGSNFAAYVNETHSQSEVFPRWYATHGSADFRTAVAANIDFIWKEALGLPHPDCKIATWHDFWREIKGDYHTPMKALPNKKPATIPKTVVTPYVFDLFSHMGFDAIMKATTTSHDVEMDHIRQVSNTRGNKIVLHQGQNRLRDHDDFVASIEVGDVISTPPDDRSTGSKWKRETSKHHDADYVWYGMVQKIHLTEDGHRSFDVIWMYQSRDTPCALMKYPWLNELFLSDTCTCETARIDEQDVLATHQVAWFGDHSSAATDQLFVRQTYLAAERCWVALSEDHMVCNHQKKGKHRSSHIWYSRGDTVLVKLPKSTRLEPCIIERLYKEDEKRWARLRKLLRRHELELGVTYPPNELVYSDQLVEIDSKRIVRHCLVRSFLPDDPICSPYNRGGTGDAFYFTTRLLGGDSGKIIALDDTDSVDFRQGFLPEDTSAKRKLCGLDLFCGGGNFGRGIEDGGGVEMRWANDISPNAIHSYMANCAPDTCTPYLGSIDDLLDRALVGDSNVPRPGDIGLISGGSPCQGFSRLTSKGNQQSMKQFKNRSLVASFASFVDHFRPQFGLLENVLSMIKTGDKRDECFFSQLVCCLVGLGYQVRIIYADAWSYGAPQSRSRVFLIFAALGVQMPKAPPVTHSHPPGTKIGTMGKMSNEQPFGERVHAPTPFDFISASAATRDLPDIRDGKADICVRFPDHRVCVGVTARTRVQFRHIPMRPFGMGYDKARYGYYEKGKYVPGTISDDIRDDFFPKPTEFRLQPGTKAWSRVHPHGLIRTVVTACGPTDRHVGQVSHWQQDRPLSVMEVRRAQGFLDHEVITGTRRQQWYIIGNSVARQVALALGLAIREAWFGSLYEDNSGIDQAEILEDEFAMIESSTETHLPSHQETPDGAEMLSRARPDIFSDANEDCTSTPATSIDDPVAQRPLIVELNGRLKRDNRHGITEDVVAKRLRLDADTA